MARVVDLHHLSGDDIRPEAFRLDVRTTSLGAQSARFGGDSQWPGIPEEYRNRVVGGSDIDGDGRSEIFVQIGHGAATGFDGIFRIWQGHLTRVTIDGRPTDLGVGGTVGVADWFSCDQPLLTVWEDQLRPNGKSYAETEDRYRLAATALVLVAHQARRVPGPTYTAASSCRGLN